MPISNSKNPNFLDIPKDHGHIKAVIALVVLLVLILIAAGACTSLRSSLHFGSPTSNVGQTTVSPSKNTSATSQTLAGFDSSSSADLSDTEKADALRRVSANNSGTLTAEEKTDLLQSMQ